MIGRNHVNPVRLDPQAVLDLDDLHGRGPLEQLDHHALVGGVQVLDNDKGHPASLGQVAQKLLDRLQPARRRAYANDGK